MVHSPTDNPYELRRLLAQKFLPFWLAPPVFLRDQIFTRLPSALLKRGTIQADTLDEGFVELSFQGMHYTPAQMHSLQPVDELCREILKYADRGYQLAGLGMLTASIGKKGAEVAEVLKGRGFVTTGNALTSETVAEAALMGTDRMGYVREDMTAVVIGAGGMVGSGICHLLLDSGVKHLALVGHEMGTLTDRVRKLRLIAPDAEIAEMSHDHGLAVADLLLTVSSSAEPIVVKPQVLKPGVVIADAARPRDVAKLVAEARDDILVTEGGMRGYGYRGDSKIGMPQGILLPCVAETLIFTQMSIGENWIGDPTLDQMKDIGLLANALRMPTVAYRLNDKPIPEEEIDRRIANAKKLRKIG